jgi:hypothetical protein
LSTWKDGMVGNINENPFCIGCSEQQMEAIDN